MRRGLMSWSRTEVPESVLEARVARTQAAMADEGLGVVMAYTSFAFPAAAHWLCNYTPYWSEAMLVVRPTGLPVLLASMTPRVHPWMRSISHLAAVLSAPRLGPAVVNWLKEHTQSGDRVGLVGLDELPASVMQPISETDRVLCDATALIDGLRHPADASDTQLASRAQQIARDALAARPALAERASEVASAAERVARLAGAEEVLLRVAPDLSLSATLLRLEGDFALGPHHAVEISVAYKGVWTRRTESFSRGAEPASWANARQAFEVLATRGANAAGVQALGPVTRWSCEVSTGLHPLAAVAGSGLKSARTLPAGSRCVLNVALNLPEGAWLSAAPCTWQG